MSLNQTIYIIENDTKKKLVLTKIITLKDNYALNEAVTMEYPEVDNGCIVPITPKGWNSIINNFKSLSTKYSCNDAKFKEADFALNTIATKWEGFTLHYEAFDE